ncbi:YbaN family protein (plasmid) [Paracoccus sp. TK19116]|uniref:YbaN family protein n=1 Tax=Paracoccus albicereus TaxID=2922394 RepID=A0ABT1MMJ7_9RHOB|nr:YbaN family protein [Paracoccus albicereus]MCQ0969324.1 YbaN family protein [Paracoccus albicereus]
MPRIAWLCIGWVAMTLAAIGVALPIMPTVPFLLVAAWAFSRSSPRLRQRIRQHKRYGPAVRAWQDHGAISRLAKVWAVLAMAAGVGLALYLGVDGWVVAIQASVCLAVALYVTTRPTV